MAEPLKTPRELLAACLRQMLWIEQQLAESMLPELSERARSPDLKRRFDRHQRETEGHVRAVRGVLADLDLPMEPEESPAFRGLVAEHEHDREVAAQDRHLGVLEVDRVPEQHARQACDDARPVAAGDGEHERAHAASVTVRSAHRGALTG